MRAFCACVGSNSLNKQPSIGPDCAACYFRSATSFHLSDSTLISLLSLLAKFSPLRRRVSVNQRLLLPLPLLFISFWLSMSTRTHARTAAQTSKMNWPLHRDRKHITFVLLLRLTRPPFGQHLSDVPRRIEVESTATALRRYFDAIDSFGFQDSCG